MVWCSLLPCTLLAVSDGHGFISPCTLPEGQRHHSWVLGIAWDKKCLGSSPWGCVWVCVSISTRIKNQCTKKAIPILLLIWTLKIFLQECNFSRMLSETINMYRGMKILPYLLQTHLILAPILHSLFALCC